MHTSKNIISEMVSTILDEPGRVLNCIACAILSHLTSNEITECVTDVSL